MPDPLRLERQHTPFQPPPTLPERLGIGPTRDRKPICRGFHERWSFTWVISINVANNATEVSFSNWIHQPFRVTRVSARGTGVDQPSLYWHLSASTDPIHPSATTDHLRRALYNQRTETANQFMIENLPEAPALHPGVIIREVPTKLRLLVWNITGSTANLQAFADLTFLAPND